MKVYIKKPVIQGAWKWIQKGYYLAWEDLGYDVEYYDTIEEVKGSGYQLMVREWDIKNPAALEVIEKAHRTYLFAQPSSFPDPWGRHPNFISSTDDETKARLNKMDNVYLWTFGDNTSFHTKWKHVHTVPLAFDSISYQPTPNRDCAKFDVSFVGGWANNGFNEKRKTMLDVFGAFKDSGLNCGFFINKNLSHEQECSVLYNSKATLNVHDAYQRILGSDTNERTFKSLGLNGVMISDEIGQLSRMFPEVKLANNPEEIVSLTKEVLSRPEDELDSLRMENRHLILKDHCYTHRTKALLDL